MVASTDPAPWSTVAALPDYLLLAQTAQLARHEQALQILVLDHLREIEVRRLHLTRGYGSLFHYVVHELDYTAAAAWRRIKAMRLCVQTRGARELLQDGSLNLSNAAQVQSLFERSDRSRGRASGSDGAGGGPGGVPRSDGEPGDPAPAAPMRAGERDAAPAAGPVLDAAAREELVRQAAGKSTREVQQMLAEVDPELAQPSDRMRALGGGRWELKAAIDAECRHGLEKLQMLLSHTDPHLTLGGLVARLVRDGVGRYDPARPRRARPTGGRDAVNAERSVNMPARRDNEAVQPGVMRGKGYDFERQNEDERDGAARAPVRHGVLGPSAPKPHAQAELGRAALAVARDGGGRAVSAPKRHTEAGSGSTESALVRGLVRRSTDGEPGSASPAAAPNRSGDTASPAKRIGQDGDAHAEEAERPGGAATSAADRRREPEYAGGQPKAVCGSGGQAASLAKRQRGADDGGRSVGVCGVVSRATRAAGHSEAGARSASPAPVRDHRRLTGSAAKRLAYAAGHGAVGSAERSPALEWHLAALSCFGALPGSRSRYIPAAVRQQVWRRDQGCCSYVDRRSGRRCGSRYRLEIDHIVPFALGGANELFNLRLSCGAHHRLRHAERRSHPASWSTEARRAPVFAIDSVERRRAGESADASHWAGEV